MADKTLNIKRLQLRHDTKANWSAKNPVLAIAEMGFEDDTNLFKIGDGTKAWDQLEYINGQNMGVELED